MAEVPKELRDQLRENLELNHALRDSGLPVRFQAMVLGLATIKQAHEHGRESEDHGPNESSAETAGPSLDALQSDAPGISATPIP